MALPGQFFDCMVLYLNQDEFDDRIADQLAGLSRMFAAAFRHRHPAMIADVISELRLILAAPELDQSVIDHSVGATWVDWDADDRMRGELRSVLATTLEELAATSNVSKSA